MRVVPMVLAGVVIAGCGKRHDADRRAPVPPPSPSAPSPAAPGATGGSAGVTAGSGGSAAARSTGSAALEAPTIVRATGADRGHLAALITRERKAGRVPVIAVMSAHCANCGAAEGWFSGPPFGKMAMIEVDGDAFARDLAALHIATMPICFYVLDGATWHGDLCAMASGTIGTAVGETIADGLRAHIH